MDWITEFLSGAGGAAFVAGIFTIIQKKGAKDDTRSKALRYIMLYIIQERAKQHIRDNKITLEDRHALHQWHELYHDGLGGNGDADALMAQVDRLPLDCEN